jgi:hypothetical protein
MNTEPLLASQLSRAQAFSPANGSISLTGLLATEEA